MSTIARDEYEPFATLELKNVMQQRLEVPALCRLLELPTEQRVLEVGCGAGVALPPLAERLSPTRFAALDIDQGLVDEARVKAAETDLEVDVMRGDVLEMPFPDNSFDIVIDFGTCYHVARPELALNEIARVLDSEGIFVHETPLSQLLAHPIRSRARGLPWQVVPRFEPARSAGFWASCRVQS